ncbi:acyl-CoA N-acyltransferase [Neocallimastix lanati (nom. inval.)]|uniref:Acyl-CoA N-acyltransferase n=1 Tax=Neocallimastix californiae TaxID=1754190 RepID=A0A1Y2EP11_9FUNG|nr:acyl-CoA N-acyltransferase [Neocallimastix sp. JGI-2020a]ORY73279.1 acyl-CoA N-acyltransferase [Neocallimastix californiae]|eukprot:ORY73279.1 acyl-CoA N-acyltransferase [Neocallimastix californiae]
MCKEKVVINDISYEPFESESQMPEIISLIESHLSEPYSIYTYRYFIHSWPDLCILCYDKNRKCVGVIVCKLDYHNNSYRGYIAMLAVDKDYRKRKIGSTLVKMVVNKMKEQNADEVVLETEKTNTGALGLYEYLGFIRDKRLPRYYLNGVDAFRLKLFLKDPPNLLQNNINEKTQTNEEDYI